MSRYRYTNVITYKLSQYQVLLALWMPKRCVERRGEPRLAGKCQASVVPGLRRRQARPTVVGWDRDVTALVASLAFQLELRRPNRDCFHRETRHLSIFILTYLPTYLLIDTPTKQLHSLSFRQYHSYFAYPPGPLQP